MAIGRLRAAGDLGGSNSDESMTGEREGECAVVLLVPGRRCPLGDLGNCDGWESMGEDVGEGLVEKTTSSGRISGDVGLEPIGDTSDELDMLRPGIGGRLAVMDMEDRYDGGLKERPKPAMVWF